VQNIRSITPEIEVFKDGKTFDLFYLAYKANETKGHIGFETNRKGTVEDIATFNTEQWISREPERFDFAVADFNNFDNQISRISFKELSVAKDVERIQLIISDIQTGINERMELRTLEFAGKVLGELTAG